MLPKLSIILAQQDRVQRTIVRPLQAPRCSSVKTEERDGFVFEKWL